MGKRVVGPDQKPDPHIFYGDSYERGPDPWHEDAFVGTPAGGRAGSKGQRREGWYLIDACGNVIGWTADGTELHDLETEDVEG